MVASRTRSRVVVSTRPLWQIRLLHGLPRYLLYATCAWGLAASARFALAPPHGGGRAVVRSPASPSDLGTRAFAAIFARRYLSWDTASPEASGGSLAAFQGPEFEAELGRRVPARGVQHVEWVEVVQARQPAPGREVYTVAAQTDSEGLLYLSVGVARLADGRLALAGYPAFVGPPASDPAWSPTHSSAVEDASLATVVKRVLRNYLLPSREELAADLKPGARVSLPPLALRLLSVQRLSWTQDRRSVEATVQTEDARGAQYTLAYELDVAIAQGRWEVSAVQMDPDA
jgi:Conjugative transposon protein TcpC